MSSLDDFGKTKRDPEAQNYIEPPTTAYPPSPSTDRPLINGKRPEESDPNNIPPQNNRLREIPQLVPLVDIANTNEPSTATRSLYNVLFTIQQLPNNSPAISGLVLTKARTDLALKDTFAESTQLSRDKALYNIFTPSGFVYSKANEAETLVQPPRPGQVLQLTNIISGVNNLSNAGTNYKP